MNSRVSLLLYRFAVIVIIWTLTVPLSACNLPFQQTSETNGQHIPVESDLNSDSGVQPPMTETEVSQPFSIGEGVEQPADAISVPSVVSEPLTDVEADNILSRLPALPPEEEKQSDFSLAGDLLPPPRTGETMEQQFPPVVTPESEVSSSSNEPLQVLRFSPEGEIPVAPFISVTFNQPMVPLATLSDISEKDIPVQVVPDLKGTWRWVGTKTLTFNYDSKLIDRLPKSTEYTVTVPAGTKSQSGASLQEQVQWKFSTPPVKLLSGYPDGITQPRDPLIFLEFDQRIDPQAVLNTINLSVQGKPVAARLSTDSDIESNPKIKYRVKNSLEGRYMVIQPVELLPLASKISVLIGPDTPSAEGPLKSREFQSFSFSTYSPLEIVAHGCSWGAKECPPLIPLNIQFNNPIDPRTFQEGMLQIDPDIPGVSASIMGKTINIQGETRGRTTYTISVSADIQDIYGQKLGKDTRLKFTIGAADKVLTGPSQNFITLDPATSEPIFTVYSINYTKLDAQIYNVQPSDWPAFRKYLQEYRRTDETLPIPGKKVFDKTIDVKSIPDSLTQTDIKLKEYLDGETGHLLVIVKPHRSLFEKEEYWNTVQAWVQVTKVGLDAIVDDTQMIAWTTDLRNGSPLEGTVIQANVETGNPVTDSNGIARLIIPPNALYLTATMGNDTSMLPRSISYWGDETWQSVPAFDELRWFVFDDRQMYKPGEEVHIKGWLRRIGSGPKGDVSLLGSDVSSLSYQILEPQGNEIGIGVVDVNPLGGFDMVFTIPTETNLGQAQIHFSAIGSLTNLHTTNFIHRFEIQEFRRPEFEVSAKNETPGPYFAGESTVVSVEANYYAGGPLPNADVTWEVSKTTSNYSPPNWPDFIFGSWSPWWILTGHDEFGDQSSSDDSDYQTYSGKTNTSGIHFLNINFEKDQKMKPVSINAQATVMDVNRQAWTTSTNLLVHPSDLYVGMHSERYFVEKGTPLKIDVIVTDLDGKLVEDRAVDVKAARLDWKYLEGRWSEVESDVQTCVISSGLEPIQCEFQTPLGGSYRITAIVEDGKSRKNMTEMTRWVSGGKRPPARKVEHEEVTLIPDKEKYSPGDTAQILVQPPFSPAEGLLTVSRSGILYTEPFRIDSDTITLKIPIDDAHIPNLNIQVDVVGSTPRVDDSGEVIANTPNRPAYATGSLNIKIPPVSRTLDIEAVPVSAELEPGEQTEVNVTAKDSNGNPVSNAEVALIVVDEAILALTNYSLNDPVSVFYANRPIGFSCYYSRSNIILVDPLSLVQDASRQLMAKGMVEDMAVGEAPLATMSMALPASPAPMMEAGGPPSGSPAQPIRIRSDFNPLAAFSPVVMTDSSGYAKVSVSVPDNLTRYRVMAVAVSPDGRQFGASESTLTARLPLMVRPSAPRFLNFGDEFELPVILQNQTDSDMRVEVAIRASNLSFTAERGKRVTVPARDRIEVRFPAKTESAGQAVFQVAAISGDYADAATIELPVYTPATTEGFATYGVLDEGTSFQPIMSPTEVFPQFGELEITTSSTALQALTDAVLYLTSYPFECSEQLASRILGIAALRDVLSAFEAGDLPEPAEMEASVQRDITRLQGLQNSDGGFPYWRRGNESIPFNTIHVAHALQRARIKGFDVPQDVQQNLLTYLQQIETHFPEYYSQYTRRTLSSYALYVRELMGDKDTQKAAALINDTGLENLSLDAIGWLWKVLLDSPDHVEMVDTIRRHIGNLVVETAGAANFTTVYDEQNYLLLGSNRRTDAIMLEAMITDTPDSDLIPKVVNGLLSHRQKGRWNSTQENVFVLLALDKYFNTFEAQTPEFVANIWLGDQYAGSHSYSGYSTEYIKSTIPMSYLMDMVPAGETRDLVISKQGNGRLYYRLGLNYAPTNLSLEPLDMGFVVERRYEAVDDPDDVRQDATGKWIIKAGAKVNVHLTMIADNRRYHVALVDPLPAGLEIVNPELAITGNEGETSGTRTSGYNWWWYWNWFDHQNLRDERAEVFTPLLWDGVYSYSYIARATTPGIFVVPPTKAEEMYSPEVFGRSASDVVVVE